ncbi:MAG TPA: serine/threonine-protein kinase [Polyangiaceae bacterium]|jgi:serine/threonine-protein kinase
MSSAPASDLGRAGQVVGGKFRLESVIGRGAMGSVWTATHVSLGHRVAIKLVAREFVKSPEALRRFDAEAKAAARLQSRHVVQVFDNGTLDDGTPYIAMELLSGENLEQRIQRGGPIALAETVDILAQCARALARAHAAGIVHRDIKPENVFLAHEPDGDADVVKILDFGVAKVTMAIEGWTSKTGTGAMLGTPIYMSPEQVRASRDVDHRTDLYSLGLVAYTMLTGRLVVEAETFGDVLLKICTQPLPSLREAAPALPPAVDAWFQRACAKDSAQRHQSAQEFVDTLRAAAGAAPPEVRPSTQPSLPTLQSAGGSSMGAAFAQTAANVSVTSAGVPDGVPRMRPGVVVAVVVSAAMVLLGGGAILLALHSHDEPAKAGAPDDSASGVRAAGPAGSALAAPGALGAASTDAAVDVTPSLPAKAAAAPAEAAKTVVALPVASVAPPPVAAIPQARPISPPIPPPAYPQPAAPRPAPTAPAPNPTLKPKFNLGY